MKKLIEFFTDKPVADKIESATRSEEKLIEINFHFIRRDSLARTYT